jgi:hypothetical protein
MGGRSVALPVRSRVRTGSGVVLLHDAAIVETIAGVLL